MGRLDDLKTLAFETRFPASLVGEAPKRTIRLNRLRTALGAAACARNYEAMVELLVELSAVAAVDERGQDYLLAHPDLVVSLGDSETLRRLFEAKTSWPGVRHARLATAYSTDGDLPEAYTQARRAEEWRRWHDRQSEQERFDTKLGTEDLVGVAAYLVAVGRTTDAARYLSRWVDPYSYELGSRLFEVCKVSYASGKLPQLHDAVNTATRCRKLPPAVIVALLKVFPGIDDAASTRVLQRLATALPNRQSSGSDHPEYRKTDSYSLGLQRCSLRAAKLGLAAEARAIDSFVAPRRFDLWSLRDAFSTEYILPWVFHVAVRATIEARAPSLFDCLPSELWQLVSEEEAPETDADQRALLLKKLQEKSDHTGNGYGSQKSKLLESDRQRARYQLGPRTLPILALARQLTAILSVRSDNERKVALASFFEGWKAQLAAAQTNYYYPVVQFR
jgi:hypothetical protein